MTKKEDNKNKLSEQDIDRISSRIVEKMMRLKSMEDWYKQVYDHNIASDEYEDLELTEEEDAIGEAARLMTLMNLFQDDEEYEKCAVIKRQMDRVNKILNKGKKR